MAAPDLPAVFRVRQLFGRPRVADPPGAVGRELAALFPPGSLRRGAQIGITVGSRGIAGIAELVRSAVKFLQERGTRPFIIPAMGSHGGATAEGQRALLAHYGVTEDLVGAPIRADMNTVKVCTTENGVDVFVAEVAWKADGVLLMNRIKPHTDFKGRIESGLSKICAIGLGKLDGAAECHRHFFDIGLGTAIRSVAEAVVARGKIVGGIAILENAYHETARIAGVSVDGFFVEEEALTEEARRLMARLPLEEIDVLWLQRMGKNISGAGLDTNIVGRSVHGYIDGEPWKPGMPAVLRVVVSELTPESDGNAVGMGMADLVTERFRARVDQGVTALNALTSCAPLAARMPIVARNDREAIATAIRTATVRENGPLVVLARDTLDLEEVGLSEACLPLVEGRQDLQVLGPPERLKFDPEGYLRFSFGA